MACLYNYLNCFPKKITSRLILLIMTLVQLASIEWVNAQIGVEPQEYIFKARQINTVSEAKTFTIQNLGDAPVNLTPSNIRIESEHAKSSGLSILSYNLWADSQNWPARLSHILKEIRELDPDLIALQEVIQRSTLVNQAKTMADSLGYHFYFSSRSSETSSTRFGNAILSRFPIIEANWRALNPLSDFRTAVHVKVEVEGNIVDFYNTHLHNAAVNRHIREEQINDLIDFIESTRSDGFLFLTGDFNANPHWPEMELVYKHFQDVYPIFHENHLDPEHGTLNYHLGHQKRRIDYVFFGKSKDHYLIPLQARVVLDKPSETGIWGSDHFGVFASFNILSDADAFKVHNIASEVTLEPSSSVEVAVSFAPFTIGDKKALLLIKDSTLPLRGTAFDATIRTFPWGEDFSGTDGEPPQGWMLDGRNWELSATDLAGGEPPEMVFSGGHGITQDSHLITPGINTQGLDSLLLHFRHSVFSKEDPSEFSLRLMVLSGEEEILVDEWSSPVNITQEQEKYMIFGSGQGNGDVIQYIKWSVMDDSQGLTGWHIDDIELIALPALAVIPNSHDFGMQRINTASSEKTFHLTNIGGGVLTIDPDDISLETNHDHVFSLINLTGKVSLQQGDTATIMVSFHPPEATTYQTSLNVRQRSVSLSGEGYDPRITQLPWLEDFSGVGLEDIPLGWTSNAVNWGSINAANAGGEAPEMVFNWQPESAGRFYLITPDIILPGKDSLTLSFKHRIRNFGLPGKYTLSVLAIVDDQETIIHEWVDPDFMPADEFAALVTAAEHGLGGDSFRLAWVFDGTTNNITQWDIDDILLDELPMHPIPEIKPSMLDFGRQTVNTISEPLGLVIRNRGGRLLTFSASEIRITGENASEFLLQNLPEIINLGPFETIRLLIAFSPASTGEKHANLKVLGIGAELTGVAAEAIPYFVYSDFTIADHNRQYTNVDGFREVPAFARNGSLIASDIQNEGSYGGAVLQLAYDLSLATGFTIYYMWAYPLIDLSEYTEIVLYIKGNEAVSGIKLQLLDTDGVRQTNGAGYTYFDISREWQKIAVPINELTRMDWAQNLPDMRRIQRLDLVFEQDKTQPEKEMVFVDLVAFNQQSTPIKQPAQQSVFHLFPNPTRDVVNIITEPGALIALLDLSGKTIMEVEARDKTNQINISGLKKGMYLIRIIDRQTVNIKKFFVY